MPARITPLRLAAARSSAGKHPVTLPLNRRRGISAYGYTQAKSLVYAKHGEPTDVLGMHTHSLSPPHGDLLTLRTLAAPLNPADINQIQGTYASLPAFSSALGTPAPSAVPGNEAVFEVLAAGSGAKAVARGDWVIPRRTGLGTWRTHLQAAEGQVLKVDKAGLRPLDAATVAVNPVTAWRMLTDFAPLDAQCGDWFVQNGANSGVGRAALQLARAWGLNNLAVVRARPEAEMAELRRELEALGATHVVTDEELQSKEFRDKMAEWTRGGREQVRLALNCVGGKPGVALAKLLAPEAHHVTYGAMARQPLALPAGLLIFKNINFTGFWVSKWGDANPEEKEKTVRSILDMVRAGTFRAGPVAEVPWNWDTPKEELVTAVQATLEGFRTGKGLLVFGDT